jgi:HK97 family phage major capsid protein
MAEPIPTNAEAVRTSRLAELRDQISKIDVELLTLHGDGKVLSEVDEARWQDLMTERSVVKPEHDKLEARAKQAEEIKATKYAELKGMPEFTRQRDEIAGADIRTLDARVARDGALRVLQSRDNGYALAPNQVDAVERHIRKNDDIARRILVTENDAYRSAFHKLMQDNNAAVYFDDDERAAMRRYYEYRAASEGTTTAGGFAIPVLIDPSVILTDQETDNPFLSISRVIDVNTNVWKGVSAAGMSWSFDAEAAEVSDDMVTLAQPTVTVYTARGFIPYSLEIGQDWPGFQDEMARLLAIGYDELLVDKFTRGSGSAEPYGIRTYLETTSAAQVTSTTDGQFGQEDVYATWAALGQKYRRRASWLMSVDMMNRVRQLGTSTNFHAYSVNIEAGALPMLFNRPVYESPYMPSFSSTTGAATRLICGDFSNYVVARRAGMTVELVPHLTSTGSNLPQGRRGWFAWARIGGAPVNASAFKIQLNT